jgi:4a-hydroxytetrahydrobiopterin dehydratase
MTPTTATPDADVDLRRQTCAARSGAPLTRAQSEHLLTRVPHWDLDGTAVAIERTFRFRNYYETIAFVNAQAWIANREDHHPDLQVGYNRCTVRFSTHSVGGLSENDFICAAKINAMLGE